MKDLETKNLKIRKFKMDDVEDVYKNLATIQENMKLVNLL